MKDDAAALKDLPEVASDVRIERGKDLTVLTDDDDLGPEVAERARHLQTDDTRPDDDETSREDRKKQDPAAMMIRSACRIELFTVMVRGSANLASPRTISAPVRASDSGSGWNSLTISRCRRTTVGQSSAMGPAVVPKRAASFASR